MEAILDQSDIDVSQFEKALNSGPRFRRAKRKYVPLFPNVILKQREKKWNRTKQSM